MVISAPQTQKFLPVLPPPIPPIFPVTGKRHFETIVFFSSHLRFAFCLTVILLDLLVLPSSSFLHPLSITDTLLLFGARCLLLVLATKPGFSARSCIQLFSLAGRCQWCRAKEMWVLGVGLLAISPESSLPQPAGLLVFSPMSCSSLLSPHLHSG